jgi:hypothetical protein
MFAEGVGTAVMVSERPLASGSERVVPLVSLLALGLVLGLLSLRLGPMYCHRW